MQEEGKKAGVDVSFMDSEAWWSVIYQETIKKGATEGAIVENWQICLETRPGKAQFFAKDYSQYARIRTDRQREEIEDELGPKDALAAEEVLAVIERAEHER